MAQGLLPVLNDLNQKIERLVAQQSRLIDRIKNLEEENKNLKIELEEERKNLMKSRNEVEFLTVSHRLADNPDSLISTRRHIARLIKTIDNCIAMINEA